MTRITVATRGGSTTLSEGTVETFDHQLRGRILVSADAGFEEATRLWNGMIDKTPAVVVQPTGTVDVVAAVNFARDHDFSIGGNYVNFQTDDDEERVRATYGDNFDRLAQAKTTYAPDDVFRSNRNIRPRVA